MFDFNPHEVGISPNLTQTFILDQTGPSGSDMSYTGVSFVFNDSDRFSPGHHLPQVNMNTGHTSRLHPPVSPDEAIIQARGRRWIPSSFSPERTTQVQ